MSAVMDWDAVIERAKNTPVKRPGRKRAPREHGSERGYQQHRVDKTTACGRCCYAHQVHNDAQRGRS